MKEKIQSNVLAYFKLHGFTLTIKNYKNIAYTGLLNIIAQLDVLITFQELEIKIADLQDDLQQIKLLNENLEEKINLQKVEHNLSLQRKTEEIQKEKEERIKEAYEKGVADSQNQVRILLKYLRNKYET